MLLVIQQERCSLAHLFILFIFVPKLPKNDFVSRDLVPKSHFVIAMSVETVVAYVGVEIGYKVLEQIPEYVGLNKVDRDSFIQSSELQDLVGKFLGVTADSPVTFIRNGGFHLWNEDNGPFGIIGVKVGIVMDGWHRAEQASFDVKTLSSAWDAILNFKSEKFSLIGNPLTKESDQEEQDGDLEMFSDIIRVQRFKPRPVWLASLEPKLRFWTDGYGCYS